MSNIDPAKWYSPNEIVDQGLLFGKSKRYVFDLIQSGKLEAVNTSDTSKPQWKIQGQKLIDFIKEIQNANSNVAS
jgi:hypothetical protein